MSTTAQRLRQVMNERSLRQKDVLDLCKPYCDRLGVTLTKSHLSQYLSGKFRPKQDKITVLAKALGVSESWLMGYNTEAFTDLPLPQQALADIIDREHAEEKLLNDYRLLNDEGKEELASYIEYLKTKYKKHDQSDMVQEA